MRNKLILVVIEAMQFARAIAGGIGGLLLVALFAWLAVTLEGR